MFPPSCFVIICKLLSLYPFVSFFLPGLTRCLPRLFIAWLFSILRGSPVSQQEEQPSGLTRTDLGWYLHEGVERVSSAMVLCLCHLGSVGHLTELGEPLEGQNLEGGHGD